ncbi:MAG: hypothetical protein A3A85_03205 [Deltaproteobacteria bacterium RIFCSPLOWO2_01_FULL_42_9]|nr:MAG: hypothetical protein A3A85_03205 [Deltaproteobacteria bacterium RIFCSPLOWO2_01_FULL_42_9]
MENQGVLLCSVYLLKDIILHPSNVFERVKQGRFQKEPMIIFGFGALITLFKSFVIKRQKVSFFANESLNQILSVLSIPQLRWVILYLVYFGFLYMVFGMCKLFNKEASLKSLMFAFISISGIGIIGQFLFYFLQIVIPKGLIFSGSYLVYLWSIVLYIQAIRVTQGISFLSTLVSFFVPAIVIIATIGLVAISPYLAWLTT